MLRFSCSVRVFLLLASGTFCSMCAISASPASGLAVKNVDQIEEMIAKSGAHDTVRALYARERAWAHVRKHIAKGDARWLKVGATLYSAADGGARQALA